MSQENVEPRALAEAALEAVNSRDLDALIAMSAEDVEFTSLVAEVEGTTFRGHDGIRDWWESVLGAFADARWDLLDFCGDGERGVLHFRVTGMLGGVPVEQVMWQAVRSQDGKLTWWAAFRTERDALKAVGLEE